MVPSAMQNHAQDRNYQCSEFTFSGEEANKYKDNCDTIPWVASWLVSSSFLSHTIILILLSRSKFCFLGPCRHFSLNDWRNHFFFTIGMCFMTVRWLRSHVDICNITKIIELNINLLVLCQLFVHLLKIGLGDIFHLIIFPCTLDEDTVYQNLPWEIHT